MKSILVYLCTLTCFLSLQAQQAFRYQGVARNAQQIPLAQTQLGILLEIYRDAPGEVDLYAETHEVTTNDFGVFTLMVGEGQSTAGDFSSIDWSTADHILSVSVDRAGGTTYTYLGESRILPVPYALYAREVANVDDADADPTNELQLLELSGDTLRLSGTNEVVLNQSFTENTVDELQQISYSMGQLGLSRSDTIDLVVWNRHGNSQVAPEEFIGTIDSVRFRLGANNRSIVEVDPSHGLYFHPNTQSNYRAFYCGIDPLDSTGASLRLSGGNSSLGSLPGDVIILAGQQGQQGGDLLGNVSTYGNYIKNHSQVHYLMADTLIIESREAFGSSMFDLRGKLVFSESRGDTTNATPGTILLRDNRLMAYDGNSWFPLRPGPAAGSGWQLGGNRGTNPQHDFIGTNDDTDVILGRDGHRVMQLGENRAFLFPRDQDYFLLGPGTEGTSLIVHGGTQTSGVGGDLYLYGGSGTNRDGHIFLGNVDQKVSIGDVRDPQESLEINGAIVIGEGTGMPRPGKIEFYNNTFWGYDGFDWVVLGGGAVRQNTGRSVTPSGLPEADEAIALAVLKSLLDLQQEEIRQLQSQLLVLKSNINLTSSK